MLLIELDLSWREYYLIDGFLFFMKQTEWSYCQISFWLWMKRNSVRLIMKRKLYARSYSLQFQRKLRYSSLHTDVVQLVRDAAMQMHGFTSQHREPVQTLWINIFYSLNVWEAGQNWGHPPPLSFRSIGTILLVMCEGFQWPSIGAKWRRKAPASRTVVPLIAVDFENASLFLFDCA